MLDVFFLFFSLINLDFLTWKAYKLEFIMLGMSRLFLHAWHVKVNFFVHAGHCNAELSSLAGYVEYLNLMPGPAKITTLGHPVLPNFYK